MSETLNTDQTSGGTDNQNAAGNVQNNDNGQGNNNNNNNNNNGGNGNANNQSLSNLISEKYNEGRDSIISHAGKALGQEFKTRDDMVNYLSSLGNANGTAENKPADDNAGNVTATQLEASEKRVKELEERNSLIISNSAVSNSLSEASQLLGLSPVRDDMVAEAFLRDHDILPNKHGAPLVATKGNETALINDETRQPKTIAEAMVDWAKVERNKNMFVKSSNNFSNVNHLAGSADYGTVKDPRLITSDDARAFQDPVFAAATQKMPSQQRKGMSLMDDIVDGFMSVSKARQIIKAPVE